MCLYGYCLVCVCFVVVCVRLCCVLLLAPRSSGRVGPNTKGEPRGWLVIGRSNNHFNNLHFIMPLETNNITTCAAENHGCAAIRCNAGCWKDDKTRTWAMSVPPSFSCCPSHPSIYLSIYLYLSVYLSIYLCISISISIYLYLSLSLYIYIYGLCVCIYTSLASVPSNAPEVKTPRQKKCARQGHMAQQCDTQSSTCVEYIYIYIYIYVYKQNMLFNNPMTYSYAQSAYNN